MTRTEVLNHKEFEVVTNKVKSYAPGFKFTISKGNIPTPKYNALVIMLGELCDRGMLKSTSIGLALNGDETERSYQKV